MFDINDKELIIKLINGRKKDSYIAPMYVKNYHETYQLSELKNIDNFNPSAFKVGFGAHVSILDKFSFPSNMVHSFEPIIAFTSFDEEQNIAERFFIIETGMIDLNVQDESGTIIDKQSDGNISSATQKNPYNQNVIDQMVYYQNIIMDFLSKQQAEIRKKRIEEAMSEYSSSN